MTTSTRRAFLGRHLPASVATLAATDFAFGRDARSLRPSEIRNPKRLVCIFLRGGVDALNLVVPYGDDDYYKARPDIAVPPPGKGSESALALGPFFALNPGLAALLPLYKKGELSAVHAVGSPNLTRSHFDAQDSMDSGTPFDSSTRDGWLNRCMQTLPGGEAGPLRGVALGRTVPRALYGSAEVLAMQDVDSFGLRAPAKVRDNFEQSFRKMYEAGNDAAAVAGTAALKTVELVRQKTATKYTPEHGAEYPKAGRALMNVARLFKADLGVQFAWVDAGGWDTHANQGAGEGQLRGKLKELGDSMAAFHRDMGSRMRDVVVVTLSEFGRTVRQNGTGGTDHGHAGAMLVMGGGVRGGRVFGKWPGLAEDQRHEGRDLAVTTDFRDVLGEVLTQHLKLPTLTPIFPGHEWNFAQRLKLFG